MQQYLTQGIAANENPDGTVVSEHHAYRFAYLQAIAADKHGDALSAVQYNQAAITWLEKIQTEPNLETASAYLALARRLRDVEEHELSLLHLNEWFPYFVAELGPHHPNVRFMHFLRGQNLLALKQNNEAIESFERAIEVYDNNIPLRTDEVEATYQILANYYRQRSMLDEAAQYWHHAALLREHHYGSLDPERGVYLHYLASIHKERAEWEQAQMLYLEARKIFLQAPRDTHFWLLFIDKALTETYMAQGQYLQAARYSTSYNARFLTQMIQRF